MFLWKGHVRGPGGNRGDQGMGRNSEGGYQSLGEVQQVRGAGGRRHRSTPERGGGELQGMMLTNRDREESGGCGKKHAFGCREQRWATGRTRPSPNDSNEWLRHPGEGGHTELPTPAASWPIPLGHLLPPPQSQGQTESIAPNSPFHQGTSAGGSATCCPPGLPALPPLLPPSSHDLWAAALGGHRPRLSPHCCPPHRAWHGAWHTSATGMNESTGHRVQPHLLTRIPPILCSSPYPPHTRQTSRCSDRI